MSNLTHEEKLLYGKLIGVLVGIAVFLAFAGNHLSDAHRIAWTFWASWLLILLVPSFQSSYLRHVKDQRIDERDSLIELRSMRTGYTILSIGILLLFYLVQADQIKGAGHILSGLCAAWMLARLAVVAKQLELHHTKDGLIADYLHKRRQGREDQILARIQRVQDKLKARQERTKC